MAIAITLKSYLDDHHVHYDTLEHYRTETAMNSAHTAHVPFHQMAKAVVLEDESGYVVTVLPSNNRLNIDWVNEDMGRNLELAPERELEALFEDCDRGAVPALGNAYGLQVIWDEQLNYATEVYFEAGDHKHLVHLQGEVFRQLMSDLPHSVISASPEYSPMTF